MTDDTTTRAPRETAETRADAIEERRRRPAADKSTDPTLRRFNITEDVLDQDKYVYRAAVEDGTRLIALTEHDDYDFVNAKGAKVKGADSEGALRYRSGTGVDGSPQYTYLLRKLRKHADEDRRAKDAQIDEAEAGRLKQTPGDAPDKSYTPKR